MQQLGQQCQLLTSPAGTTAGHGRVLVVVERALDAAQQLGGVQVLAQAAVGLGHLRPLAS